MAAIITRGVFGLFIVGTFFASLVVFLPSLLLLPFSLRAYRWYSDVVISSWLCLSPVSSFKLNFCSYSLSLILSLDLLFLHIPLTTP